MAGGPFRRRDGDATVDTSGRWPHPLNLTDMDLDVIIPTYNRAPLLRRTLQSLLDAPLPDGLTATIVVVDNNSKDDTRATVESFAERFDGRLQYVFESRPGRSHAINAGVAASTGEFIGMIDDDEEVDAEWFEEIARAFSDPTLDVITGPCSPRWGAEPPAWLPLRPSSVVGWMDAGPEIRTFGVDYEGIVMGGNAVVRRSLLARVGGYDPSLGRTSDGRLLSCEDREMHERLVEAGARGQYRPKLIIHHFIPAERLTRRYHRRWFFWHGVSSGVLARTRTEPVPHLLGVPRHRVGSLLRAVLWTMPGLVGVGPLRTADARFDSRMHAIDLVGYWYGRYRFRPALPKAAADAVATSLSTPATST